MPNWTKEAEKQIGEIQIFGMTTQSALGHIEYWRRERGGSLEICAPLVMKVLEEAPERKRIASKLFATDRLLKLIFGTTKTNPQVNNDVKAEVLDFIRVSARILDQVNPDATAPRFVLSQQNTAKLARDIAGAMLRPRKSSGSGAILAILALVLIAGGRR